MRLTAESSARSSVRLVAPACQDGKCDDREQGRGDGEGVKQD